MEEDGAGAAGPETAPPLFQGKSCISALEMLYYILYAYLCGAPDWSEQGIRDLVRRRSAAEARCLGVSDGDGRSFPVSPGDD